MGRFWDLDLFLTSHSLSSLFHGVDLYWPSCTFSWIVIKMFWSKWTVTQFFIHMMPNHTTEDTSTLKEEQLWAWNKDTSLWVHLVSPIKILFMGPLSAPILIRNSWPVSSPYQSCTLKSFRGVPKSGSKRQKLSRYKLQRGKGSLQEKVKAFQFQQYWFSVLALSDLVLQAAVFSLCVLPDDHDVNVLVTSLNSGEGLAVHHIGKQVQARADHAHIDQEKGTVGGIQKKWVNSHSQTQRTKL